MRFPRLASATTIILLLSFSSNSVSYAAGGGAIRAKDAALFVQQEVATHNLGLLGQMVGPDPGNAITWTGEISDTGWTYHAASPYRDGFVNIDYVGSYDGARDVVDWSGSMMFVNPLDTWSVQSSGSYTDAVVDGFWSELFEILIEVVRVVVKVAVVGVQVTHGGGAVLNGASRGVMKVVDSVADSVIDELHKKKDEVKQETFVIPDPVEPPYVPPHLRKPRTPIKIKSSGVISDDLSSYSTISGVVDVDAAPEPSTWILMITGFGFTGAALRRRRPAAAGS